MNKFILLMFLFIWDQCLFYWIEKWYCKRYYNKKVGCRCWSCRFYDICKYSNKKES